jgi:hypothetical protein
MEHDLGNTLNMKLTLYIFLQLSKLKRFFHKSGLFRFDKAQDVEDQNKELFGRQSGSFPFRYLGIHIYFHKLESGEWKPMERS